MARSPYDILGISKTASEQEIKSAYRKLAKQYHPDQNKGDKAVEQKFKDISKAYDILGNKQKKAKFDRGEIDADGNEVHPGFNFNAGGRGRGQGGNPFSDFGSGGFDASDIFGNIFGDKGFNPYRKPQQAPRHPDIQTNLKIPFLEAANGSTKSIRLSSGKTLDVKIPPGIENGKTLRLKGQGHQNPDGSASDVLITIDIMDDPKFIRKGWDIYKDQHIPLNIAVLGGKVPVETLSGTLNITVPPYSSSGKTLRLKGKGIYNTNARLHGDFYVKLLVDLPKTPMPELEKFVKAFLEEDA